MRYIDQTLADLGMDWRPGVARIFACNHPAFFHQDFGREKAGLAVLVIDQRQPALIKREGLIVIAR